MDAALLRKHRMLRATFACFVLLGVLPQAHGGTQDEWAADARRHYEAGLGEYAAGHYRAALDELLAADRIETRPKVLYAAGQAARKLGDCGRAIAFFRAFAESAPSASSDAASAARAQISRCEAELGAKVVPAPVAPPTVAAQIEPPSPARPDASAVSVTPRQARSVGRELAAGLLVGTGVALAAGGAGLLGWGEHLVSDAGDSLTAFDDARRSAPRFRMSGQVLLGVGAGAALGGIAFYVSLIRRRR